MPSAAIVIGSLINRNRNDRVGQTIAFLTSSNLASSNSAWFWYISKECSLSDIYVKKSSQYSSFPKQALQGKRKKSYLSIIWPTSSLELTVYIYCFVWLYPWLNICSNMPKMSKIVKLGSYPNFNTCTITIEEYITQNYNVSRWSNLLSHTSDVRNELLIVL